MREDYFLVNRLIKQISSTSGFNLPETQVLQSLQIQYGALTYNEFLFRLITNFFGGSNQVTVTDYSYGYNDGTVYKLGMGDFIMGEIADIITNSVSNEILNIDICDLHEKIINMIGVFISYLFPIRKTGELVRYQLSYNTGGLFSWSLS